MKTETTNTNANNEITSLSSELMNTQVGREFSQDMHTGYDELGGIHRMAEKCEELAKFAKGKDKENLEAAHKALMEAYRLARKAFYGLQPEDKMW